MIRRYLDTKEHTLFPVALNLKSARSRTRFPLCDGEFFVFLGNARHFLNGRDALLDLFPAVIAKSPHALGTRQVLDGRRRRSLNNERTQRLAHDEHLVNSRASFETGKAAIFAPATV